MRSLARALSSVIARGSQGTSKPVHERPDKRRKERCVSDPDCDWNLIVAERPGDLPSDVGVGAKPSLLRNRDDSLRISAQLS